MDKGFARKTKGDRDMPRGIRCSRYRGADRDTAGQAGWRGAPC